MKGSTGREEGDDRRQGRRRSRAEVERELERIAELSRDVDASAELEVVDDDLEWEELDESRAAQGRGAAGRVTGGRGKGAVGQPVDPQIELLDSYREITRRLEEEVGRVVVGQEEVVAELLWTLFAGGHAILEGVPGLAKTLLVNTLASALSLESGRVQFTPDLMPSDVTGTMIVREDPLTGERSFQFRQGPIFTNMLLADEVNRTPPKTQAALLEGMGEGHVTVVGQRYRLPTPFVVLATQNPIEQEGTYPLPEAQLDRFLLKVHIDYPTELEERVILERTTGTQKARAEPVVARDTILRMQELVRALPTTAHLREYATRLVRRTRPRDPAAPAWVRDHISWGAGPRGVQSLLLAAKARTLLSGRVAVTREDLHAVAKPVLRHRLLPSFLAEAEGLTADDIIDRLLRETPAFAERPDHDVVARRILRL